jgi:hypothetical protein
METEGKKGGVPRMERSIESSVPVEIDLVETPT